MDKRMHFTNAAKMSLFEATKPLLIVSRFVGMNPISHWHKIYTIFIILFEILVIGYVWQYYASLDVNNYYFNILVHALEDACRVASLVLILSPGLFDKNRYIVPLKELASVDGSLMTLGGYMDNRDTYRFQILLVIYLGLVVLFFGVVKFSLYILPVGDGRLYKIVLWSWSFYLAIIVVCAVADCSFVSTLFVIRRRLNAINLIIHRTRQRGLYLRPNFLDVSRVRTDHDVLKHLRILRKQYHNLWRIANQVNQAYGLHLLMGAMTSLALITSQLWISYSVFANSDKIKSHITVDGIIWALFYVMRMFLLVNASVSTVAEAKAVSITIQEFGMSGDHDHATKEEIRDFLTQLQLEVLKFTACGFFDVDFTLICGILGAACTYLVILIQMGDSTPCVIGHFNESIHVAYENQ